MGAAVGDRRARVGIGVLAATLVAGCSVVSGTAASDADGFDAGQRSRVALESSLRSIDPCGLLVERVPAGLGRIQQYGPASQLSACTALVRSDDGTETYVELAILPSALSQAARTQSGRLEGIQVYRGGGPDVQAGKCERLFRLGADDSDRGLDRQLAAVRVNGVRGTDTCGVAEAVLVAAVGLVKTGLPQRNTSGALQFPLAGHDPCAVLTQFPEARRVVDLAADPTPFQCTFFPGAGGKRGDEVTLGFGIRAVKKDPPPQFEQSDLPGSCQIVHQLDQTVDITRPDAQVDDFARRIGHSAAEFTVLAKDCALGQGVATAAERAFG